MKRDEAVKRVQRKFGFSTSLSSEIIDALQDAQVEAEAEAFLPWFLHTTSDTDLSTIASQRFVLLSGLPGFLGIIQDVEWEYIDSTGKFVCNIEKHDRAYLNKTFKDDKGTPQAFDLDKTNVYVFPLPDAVYTIRVPSYYKADTVLTSNVENDWLKYAHELIIGKAGVQIAEARHDRLSVRYFEQMELRGLRRLVHQDTAKDDVGRRYAMGGPD